MSAEPLLKRRGGSRPGGGLAVWSARVALGLCLFFASEIVLWTEVTRPMWTWAVLVVGYVAVGAGLLDLLTRARVHELFGGLVLAGTYGLTASLLLNPGLALAGLPVSIVTRVMGAQTLAGVLGLALFLALARGSSRGVLLVGGLVLGALWGQWVRGYPALVAAPVVGQPVVIGFAVGGLVLVVLAAVLLRRGLPRDVDAFRLSGMSLGVVAALLALLFAWQMFRGLITRDALSYVVVLWFFCGMILWFQHRSGRDHTLVTGGGTPLSAVAAGIIGVIFVVAGLGSYLVAGAGPTDPDAFSPAVGLSIVFGAVGLAWLPAVCVVLGVRAYRQTARTGQELL
jgi:hypothetical protein